ncbi:MAG: hypothetical protein GX352_05080 [Clostridiales bacterium]|nr:hypothetical protein [Clostridiales bacterium]
MEKFLQMGLLLEIYGGMLTDRQKDAMDLYYNYDLSLSEIGEQLGISRQGVYDLIRRSEEILMDLDGNMEFLEAKVKISNVLAEVFGDLENIRTKWGNATGQIPDQLKKELDVIMEKLIRLRNGI